MDILDKWTICSGMKILHWSSLNMKERKLLGKFCFLLSLFWNLNCFYVRLDTMAWLHFATIKANQPLCWQLLARGLEQCKAAYPFLRTYMQWEQHQYTLTIDTLKRQLLEMETEKKVLLFQLAVLQLQLHHQESMDIN